MKITKLNNDEIQIDDLILSKDGYILTKSEIIPGCGTGYQNKITILLRKLAEKCIELQKKNDSYLDEWCKIPGRENY